MTDVKGSWIVPRVDCTRTPDSVSASWIGIDGVDSFTVEQVGTISSCYGSTAVYAPWFEFFPEFAEFIPRTVHPGDVMNAEVKVSGGVYALSLCDADGSWCWGTSAPGTGFEADSSAEWITEAYSVCPHGLFSCEEQPLASFDRAYYGEAYTGFASTNYAQIGQDTGSIGSFAAVAGLSVYNIEMVYCPGGCPVVTSSLILGGSSFYTTWAYGLSIYNVLSSQYVTLGEPVKDSAVLTHPTGNAGGTVEHEWFFGLTCSGVPKVTSQVKVTRGIVPSSRPLYFNSPGYYSWRAVYSGDGNNKKAISPCKPMVVIGVTHTAVTCTKSYIRVGESTVCTASVYPTYRNLPHDGFVLWITFYGSGRGTFSSFFCRLSSGRCSVTFTATAPGRTGIYAVYFGDRFSWYSFGREFITIV